MAVAPFLGFGSDVFSDAATWHRGFHGTGTLVSGSKTAFPDSLRIGDSESVYHSATVSGDTSGVALRTETVQYPYANESREETVAYLAQPVATVGGVDKVSSTAISITSPHSIDNTDAYTCFCRFKWDGSVPTNNQYACVFTAGWNWNNKVGVRLDIKPNGSLYTQHGQCATTVSDFTVASNVWTDVAMVVSDMSATIYLYSTNYVVLQKKTFSINNDGAKGSTCGNEVKLGVFSPRANAPYSWSSAHWQAFRGSIHSYASWPRALSEYEVRQVLSWPRTDLVRLGTANGSSLEFGGDGSSAVSANTADEWIQMSPSLTESAPYVDIAFSLPSLYVGMGQILRITGAPGSSGVVSASVNGRSVATVQVRSGIASCAFIRKDLFIAGSNILRLSRISGDVEFDAIALGGGFQNGSTSSDFYRGTTDTEYSARKNTYYSMDGNDGHFMGSIIAPSGHWKSSTVLHFAVPNEVLGNDRYSFRFSSALKGYTVDQVVGLFLNGSETPIATVSVAKGSTQSYRVDIPVRNIVSGDNTLKIAVVEPTGSSYLGYTYIEGGLRLEPKCASGFVITFY